MPSPYCQIPFLDEHLHEFEVRRNLDANTRVALLFGFETKILVNLDFFHGFFHGFHSFVSILRGIVVQKSFKVFVITNSIQPSNVLLTVPSHFISQCHAATRNKFVLAKQLLKSDLLIITSIQRISASIKYAFLYSE